jgi:hypothetical protein
MVASSELRHGQRINGVAHNRSGSQILPIESRTRRQHHSASLIQREAAERGLTDAELERLIGPGAAGFAPRVAGFATRPSTTLVRFRRHRPTNTAESLHIASLQKRRASRSQAKLWIAEFGLRASRRTHAALD